MFLPGLKAPGVFCFLQHVSFFLVITAIFLADTRKCATAVADDKFCLLTGNEISWGISHIKLKAKEQEAFFHFRF